MNAPESGKCPKGVRGSAPRIKKSKIQSDCVTQSVCVFVTKKFSLGEPSKKMSQKVEKVHNKLGLSCAVPS